MADPHHDHGKMDISEHERTFAGFVRFVTNGTIAILVLLVFLLLIAG